MSEKQEHDNNPYRSMAELQIKAMLLFDQPYDDREYRSPKAPSVRQVAEELGTTVLRARKLLITAERYSTKVSREVQERTQAGQSVEQIMKEMKLSRSSVYSYLPYNNLAYNLEERSANACRHSAYRLRKRACEELKQRLSETAVSCGPDLWNCFWNAVSAFAGYPFVTEDGVKFQYQMTEDGNLQVARSSKVILRNVVEDGFSDAVRMRREQVYPARAEDWDVLDAVYLYPLFKRLEIITEDSE